MRPAVQVMNTILGGGMSSRLFKRVREELGLAYSVYSYCTHYEETGVLSVYALSLIHIYAPEGGAKRVTGEEASTEMSCTLLAISATLPS